MIDAFEQKHGPVGDRSIFDGEIVVPPHLRNISLTSIRANRLHGSIFGSLSRSRTFLNLPQNARHTIHGSVPDLSRNQFTFSSLNSNNSMGDVDDMVNGGRRMSSSSAITKITLNTSTTLTLADNSSGYLSNGNVSQYSSDRSAYPIESIDEHGHNILSDDSYKSNSIRSLNDIQLREQPEDPTLFCQSLGRPNRTQKSNIYAKKMGNSKNPRAQSMEAYQTEGYMTLIKTNLAPSSQSAFRSSLNRTVSPVLHTGTSLHDINAIDATNSQLNTSTSTFQRKPTPPPPPPPHKFNHFSQNSGGLAHELSLNNITKFKLPRVSLHSTVTNPPQ